MTNVQNQIYYTRQYYLDQSSHLPLYLGLSTTVQLSEIHDCETKPTYQYNTDYQKKKCDIIKKQRCTLTSVKYMTSVFLQSVE